MKVTDIELFPIEGEFTIGALPDVDVARDCVDRGATREVAFEQIARNALLCKDGVVLPAAANGTTRRQ
jgi:hypothetical protein